MFFRRSEPVRPPVDAAPVASADAPVDVSPLLDAFGQVLGAFGQGSFDLPGRPADDTVEEMERWRRHTMIGTPLEGTDHLPLAARDFRGASRAFADLRRSEKRFVESSLHDLRDALWTCVHRVHIAVQADLQADAATEQQVGRVQTAIQFLETDAIKTEVLQAMHAMEVITASRKSAQEQAYAELAARIETLGAQLAEARRESETDVLTALGNRKRFERAAERVVQMHTLNRAPAAIVLMDLDGLKAINDSLGHEAGDSALITFAATISKVFLGDADVLCRLGGDEFVAVLPNTDVKVAARLAERVVQSFAEQRSPFGDDGPTLSVSAGFAALTLGEASGGWLKRADRALYDAKRDGKGRAVAG